MNTWTRISAEDAKSHPLYGVRGWLSGFAFVLAGGFFQIFNPILSQAFKEVGPINLMAHDIPIIRFLKAALVIYAVAVIVIYWMLFSKHQSFRPVSSYILLSIWPAEALVGILDPSPAVVNAIGLSFFQHAFNCAIWVTYLQRSKRVRVTFEHSVKAGQDNVVATSDLPSDPKTRETLTNTPTIDTTHKKTDQDLDDPKHAITRDPVQNRQSNDDSPRTRVQATPPGESKAMSFPQPTANPISPVSIPAEPSQNTTSVHEDRLYEQIAQELETNTVDKGLWTKAYAQAGGDDQQTRVLYIKARFARLFAIEDARLDPIRRERQESARLAHVHSIRSNLQSRMEKIETAGDSIELKNLAAERDGNDFLYNCRQGEWFLGKIKRIFEANPFVLEQTTADEGYTGLHLAVRSKAKKMTEYLVAQGANIKALDSQGKTPLDIARETNQPEVVELLERFRAEG